MRQTIFKQQHTAMIYLFYPYPSTFDPTGGWGSAFLVVLCAIMAYKEATRGRVKKKLPPDPHPQKYTYRSFLFEILFFILAVGALVFELGIMGYLS